MKNIKLLFILFLLPTVLLAQQTIQGKITDDKNMPLPGASILVKGTSNGAVANFDGAFTIAVKKTPATLIISYLGYFDKEVKIVKQDNIVVVLEEDNEQLDEVVVVGYGSSSKRDITGALTEIKEDENISSQYATVGAVLQGRTAGVQVSSNAGTPGAPTSIRIRGSNSLRGNNEPLYVVDGVIIDSAGEDVRNATSTSNDSQQNQNGLTGINPRDIESMVVLKDASATAIYGSRGANGVILITTKKGKLGSAVVNVFGTTTISEVNGKIPVLDALDYARYRNEGSVFRGNPEPFLIAGSEVFRIDQTTGDPIGDPLRQVNWQDEIFKTGFSSSVGLNISGASDKSNYYLSATFNDTQGVLPKTFLVNSNLQLNYTSELSDRLELRSRVGIYLGRGNMGQGTSISGGNRSFARQLVSYNPLVDGEIEEEAEDELINPFNFVENFQERIRERRLNASIFLTYKITNNLKYQLRAGSNYRYKYRSRWYSPQTFNGQDSNGLLALSEQQKIAYSLDNLLIYNKRFQNNHRLNATLGVSYDGSNIKNEIYEVGNFPVDNLRDESPQLGATTTRPFSAFYIDTNLFSYLGRFTYTIKNKYQFNMSFRADRSSKFQGNNQVGYFPAASFGWTVSNEKFLKNSKTVSNFKLRASWGKVGNQAISPYNTLSIYTNSLYSNESNGTVIGVSPINIANRDLTWETTTQLNAGFDLSLFDDRITSSFDIYHKETTDLLINNPVPTSTGFQVLLQNQGGLQNRGVEFTLNAMVVDNDDFSLSIGGNIAVNRSKLLKLSLPDTDIWIDGQLESVPSYLGRNVSSGSYKSPANAFIEGQEIGLFWGFKTSGIYEDQAAADAGPTFYSSPNLAGDVIFDDTDGDGNINDLDRTNIGNPNPDFTYGLNADLTYKNFSLSMLFNGVEGNDILNGNLISEENVTGDARNIRASAYENVWTPTNPTGTIPRMGSQTTTIRTTDRLIEDGSYLRLNNVTLSYDFSINEKAFIKGLRLFASGNNLLTITNYSGYDPELTSFLYDGTRIGVDWVGTPNITSFVLGANIKF